MSSTEAGRPGLRYHPTNNPLAQTEYVLARVRGERSRQEELRAEGKFASTAASPDSHDFAKLVYLSEEVGELAEAMLELSGEVATVDTEQVRLENAFAEAVQVAAVATAIAESLVDRGAA